MTNLDDIKLIIETYSYPWINPINNKQFKDRNSLLSDLKRNLSLDEYRYVYPTKYVYIKNYNINDIISNSKINCDKILSPLNNKWYDYNKILSHLACFFNNDDKIYIIYELFKYYNKIPKCCFSGCMLEKQDIICGKITKTHHPDNYLFFKYSHKLTKEDYNKIHSNILLDDNIIKKRQLKKEEFLKDNEKVKIWKEKVKNTHTNMSHPWLTDVDDQEKNRRKIKSSNSQKRNILEGKFNPQNNYRTKRRIEIFHKNKKYYFRSSWEVCFFLSNDYLNYESLRIKYIKDNIEKIYIPDFIDEKNKIIYELKPKRQYISQLEKMNGAIKWCLENNFKFIWINEYNLIKYIDKNICLNKEYSLYYNKMIKGLK